MALLQKALLRRVTVARRASSSAAAALSPEATTHYGWNPVTNPAPPPGSPWLNQTEVEWPACDSVDAWLASTGQSLPDIARAFERDGYAVVRGIVPSDALGVYTSMHDRIVSGSLLAPGRHDLGAHAPQVRENVENVGQVMWPSDLVDGGRDGPLHERSFALARALVGVDAAFDFDMLIWKEARTETETPWHQDEAYWPEGMTDKRALTVWCALDEATVDNGCMWHLPGSHRNPALYEHRSASEGSHILATDDVDETTEGARPSPLQPGDAVVWHGRTAHYSRGNSTDARRRTFICNFRPESMVRFERENGFDHLRTGDWNRHSEHKA
jgi:hypothetical protein